MSVYGYVNISVAKVYSVHEYYRSALSYLRLLHSLTTDSFSHPGQFLVPKASFLV